MGGVAGHMAHLSEDLSLTFNELVDILGKVARAEVENVTEKVDGQNLFLTVDDYGNVRTARNNTDVKKGGMSTEEYVAKWQGHPAENAFTNGFKAISKALESLDASVLQELFAGGQRYVNMEIMYPQNPNIIQYSAPQIVLHGLQYFGDNEDQDSEQSEANEAFRQLSDALAGAEQEVGEEQWTINGPTLVSLQKLADGAALDVVTNQIRNIAKPVGMESPVRDLVNLHLQQFAIEEGLPRPIVSKLIQLVLYPEEAKKQGITVTSLKKGLPKDLQSIVSKLGTKTNSRKAIAAILHPLEKAISDFAIEVLRGIKSFFVSDHEREVVRMRDELEKSINYLRHLAAGGNEDMGALVDKQLSKLGDIENVASSLEGVVFEYPPGSGKIYKLTGAFAMANQIIGRARRSGMDEVLNRDFTIVISKDTTITKPIVEWLREAKNANHTYQKLPELVFRDILDGTPIVDIVEQQNAEETVYNAVLSYVNGLEEDVEIEFEDDEASDPVEDDEFSSLKTVTALVPGAFKPPHRGHAEMVRKYLNSHNADRVVVLVSAPAKSSRPIPGVRDEGLSTEDALAVWDLLLGSDPQVDVVASPHATPVSAAYALVDKPNVRAGTAEQAGVDPIQAGDRVILGASKKGGDWKRWAGADKYVSSDLELLDPEKTAVDTDVKHEGRYMQMLASAPWSSEMPSVRDSDKDPRDFHAGDMRFLLEKAEGDELARAMLGDFVGEDKVQALLGIFGISGGLEEISAMAGGSVAGASGPWQQMDVGRENNQEKARSKLVRRENLDLSTVDEVIRLIMEKGIMR